MNFGQQSQWHLQHPQLPQLALRSQLNTAQTPNFNKLDTSPIFSPPFYWDLISWVGFFFPPMTRGLHGMVL